MIREGKVATCNPLGAGKWRKEYNDYFTGKSVVLIPDNDEAGKRHMEDVAVNLHWIADEIRVVPLPDVAEKGDVSDLLEAPNSLAELEKLVSSAMPWRPESTLEARASERFSLLETKTANQWLNEAKIRPMPKKLFGDFWYEGEMCILFADTGLGKSTLAVQIGECISRGSPFRPLKIEVEPQKVLYIDCELCDKQLETRYSEFVEGDEFAKNHYVFSDLFFRAELSSITNLPDSSASYEDLLFQSIEEAVEDIDPKIVIVDNITYLRRETEKAKDALPLMKQLKRLKSEKGLSLLVLAHTPKRDLAKPITRNDLQGSKMLINFTDSSFAIGESRIEGNYRYLKQIKERNTSKKYGEENVVVCELVKRTNFLAFEYVEFGRESQHLRYSTSEDTEELVQAAKALKEQGFTQREIAERIGRSPSTVNSYLNR